jgi:MOSC domain-containing protein YiiM
VSDVGRSIGLAAVNVGTPMLLADDRREQVWSGIRKHPVDPEVPLWLSLFNLAGDSQADLEVHGGPDKAVYAYPSEHLAPWAEELGEVLGDAPFGENLSTEGVLEADVRIGDIWEWGSAVLQVTQPRWPCFKLVLYRGRTDIQTRLLASGRTGWYLRVLEAGAVSPAGPIRLIAQDGAGITVLDAHRAMDDRRMNDPALVRAVSEHPALADQWQIPLARRLERRL